MAAITPFTPLLRQRFPQIHSIDNPVQLLDYAVDERLPDILLQPQTIEEAAQIVKFLHEQQLSVLPRGNGTHMSIGDQPAHINVLLETTALNHVLEHEAPDLTCRTEAGITLAQLQSQLKKTGQRLALDPPNTESTTIGGILAINDSGPKRLRYGSARDQVIGLSVIQANGEISHSGGRVVKNVAGYDLNKLYIGSFGTLGIIVEANFKLYPLAAAERTLLFTFESIEEAMQTTISLTSSTLAPSAIELIALHGPRDASPFFAFSLPDTGYTLAVNFENSTIAMTRQINEALKIAQTHHAFLREDLEGQEQEHFWQMIGLQIQSALSCKINLPVTRIAELIHQVEAICQHQHLMANIVAHAGNGIAYVELGPYNAMSEIITAMTTLRAFAQANKGSLVLERCSTQLKQRLSVWGEPRADFYMMKRLKHQFDPDGVFVRGRYLGGL